MYIRFYKIIFSVVLIFCAKAPNAYSQTVERTHSNRFHKLPLLPRGQQIGYIEGFNPDNTPKLRKVMDGAFEAALKNGMRVARVQFDWTDIEPIKGVCNTVKLVKRLSAYQKRGLAIHLLLCSADTDALNYPRDLLSKNGKNMAKGMTPDNPLILARYNKMLDAVLPIAKKYGVYCISVGNEPDTQYENNPKFMTRFIAFVSAVRDHVHAVEPDIAITYTSTCDPVTHPERGYGKKIADAVDVFCFNLYGLGNSNGFDRAATASNLNAMLKLAKGKPVIIQELGCSSLRNPDNNWRFHKSSPVIQKEFFQWVFKKINGNKQIRVAYVFQLVENSPYIDKWYRDVFADADTTPSWKMEMVKWLKGLGLISFGTATPKPAWNEFLREVKLITQPLPPPKKTE